MSIHEKTKTLKQPIFDAEGNFQEWSEFSPKTSANSVLMPTGDTSVADALGQLGERVDDIGGFTWNIASGIDKGNYAPCIFLGCVGSIATFEMTSDFGVTMKKNGVLQFLVLGVNDASLIKNVHVTLNLIETYTAEQGGSTNFTSQSIQNADLTVSKTTKLGNGLIVELSPASGAATVVVQPSANYTRREVVGVTASCTLN